MKKITLILFVLITVTAYSHKDKSTDSLVTKSGWVIYVGDTLMLGMGTMPNGDFRYITNKSFGKGLGNSTPW